MTRAMRFRDVLPAAPGDGWPGPISFEVEEGAFALVSTTRAVATSLTRLMAGLQEPARGTVEVLGARPGSLGRRDAQAFRRRLGIAFDEPAGLVSNLTVRMNLVVPMLYSGLAGMAEAQRRAAAVIDRCSLHRWADTRPADVPPEIRREVVLARAVVREPELLIVEEPTAGLRADRARSLLSLCRERARTVVVATSAREGLQYEQADTVIALDDTRTEMGKHEVGVV